MKAMIVKAPGGTEQFSIEDVAMPQPQAGEVLVKVHALSINPVDVKTRKGGAFYKTLSEPGPVILGWDISGVVAAVGSGVQKFKEGDAVFGMVNFPGRGNAYAEYVAAPETHLAHKPAAISHAEAAAACLAALTAWQVLVEQAGLKRGQQVLIHAAAGGVGHYAVQIARYLGAMVSGTASATNQTFLRELGVQNPIDYKSANAYDQLKNIDVVLDPVGGDTTARSLEVMAPGGTLVSIVGGVKEHLQPRIAEQNVQAKNYLVHSSRSDAEQIAQLLKDGHLRSHISQQFLFEELPEAHQQLESGHTKGKLVINLL